MPIALPVLGAGSAFILNLIMKSQLSSESYGGFAAALFSVAILYMIAGLGFEQVLVRLSTVSGDSLILDRSIVVATISVIIISPAFCSVVMMMFGVIDYVDVNLIVMAIVISASILFSTLYKIQGNILSHYLFLHAWKIFLLLMVVVGFISDLRFQDYATTIYTAVIAAFIVSLLISPFKNIKIKTIVSDDSLIVFTIAGLVSVMSFSVFDGLDRILVGELFNRSVFGDYFFIFAFLISPVGIVSSYISAKRLKLYKQNFNLSNFKSDYFYTLAISLLIASVFAIALDALVRFGFIILTKDYYSIMAVVFLLAVVRGGYGMLSLAYSVLCSSRILILVGLFFASMSVAVFYFITGLMPSNYLALHDIGIVILALWIFRSYFYWFLIGYSFKEGRLI
tara:strand:- start:11243 stop:12430 length:1188 start_codon:yes stop_codon:yes gene_type:complete